MQRKGHPWIWPAWLGYHHHAVQQAGLCPGSRLQPLHGPLLHDGRDMRVVHVEDPEPRQVHPRVAVGLQV